MEVNQTIYIADHTTGLVAEGRIIGFTKAGNAKIQFKNFLGEWIVDIFEKPIYDVKTPKWIKDHQVSSR